MFGKEKIPQIQAQIEELAARLRIARSQAAQLFAHGQKHSSAIPDFYALRLREDQERTRTQIEALPADYVAGWDNKRAWQEWRPSTEIHEFSHIRIGDLLDLRANKTQLIPGFLPFISQKKTIVIRSGGNAAAIGLSLLQSLVVRTALMLPHQARYTLVDPAGAGLAFPMRRHLPQVMENTGDVRRDLESVISDIQRIIETYLDAKATSFDQVSHSMRVNEAYHFVFAANFPKDYDRRAIEVLRQIANTGAEAGVYLFVHHNTDVELPRDISMDMFERMHTIDVTSAELPGPNGLQLRLDASPSPEVQEQLFQALQASKPPERTIRWDDLPSIESNPQSWWLGDATERIATQVGFHGNQQPLTLWFGAKDGRPCAHGVLGAMTGSGKSNLYHAIIAGLATRYSPEELRMYLIDGKDGVEFQPYRSLPHAEVVSLRSSPELSRSVLSELIAEKERRNDLFTAAGARDFVEYRRKGQMHGQLPRVLLLVDEYQELFEGDQDGIASDMLLQLAAQGRSAGIHMYLGSQHFGAAGMMHRQKIFGNFHLRSAMQMANDDVQALTEFGRKGKTLISTTCNLPGKIVINDQSGDDSANLAGKVAYLESDRRDEVISMLGRKAEETGVDLPARVIFDGKKQPGLLDNPQFSTLLHLPAWPASAEMAALAHKPHWDEGFGIHDWFEGEYPHIVWLGQDFSVRGQAKIVLRRRVAENAMVVGAANPERFGMLASILASLTLNAPPGRVRFIVVDFGIPDTPWGGALGQVVDELLRPAHFEVQMIRSTADFEQKLRDLVVEIDRRKSLSRDQQNALPELFLVAADLDRVDSLRRQVGSYGLVDSELGQEFARIYAEGPPIGVHCVLSFSGVQTMASVIDARSGLPYFRHRVGTQMSEDASHALIRNRLASRLQLEGPSPVNAVYFDTEHDQAVRFKPYSTKLQADELTLSQQLQRIAVRLQNRRTTL